MPIQLSARPFDAALLPELASFDCGKDQFGKIATDWIRCVNAAESALHAMNSLETEVFLYNAPDGTLVGFGSLGKTKRQIKGTVEVWSIIPHVGIAHHLRRQPPGADWRERYGAAVMIDLMSLARDHQTPTLMLKVHKLNHGATTLYERLGFGKISGPNADGYNTMTIENHD